MCGCGVDDCGVCVDRGDGVGSVISVGAHVPSFVSRKGREHR